MDNEQLKANVTSGKQWVRLLFMVLYAIALYFASMLMWVIVVLQFLFALFTGKDNAHLRSFGYALSTYLYDVYRYLTYSSDEKPFPFADWPDTPAAVKEKGESMARDLKAAVEKTADQAKAAASASTAASATTEQDSASSRAKDAFSANKRSGNDSAEVIDDATIIIAPAPAADVSDDASKNTDSNTDTHVNKDADGNAPKAP